MPSHIPWKTTVTHHPGSSAQDIHDEPSWSRDRQHRIGYRNRQEHIPGLTHRGDDPGDVPELTNTPDSSEPDEEAEVDKKAKEDLEKLKSRVEKGELVNFRDIVSNEKDLHLQYPKNRSIGWRYVLQTSEDWVKNRENWPANIEKKRKDEEAKKQRDSHTSDGVQLTNGSKDKPSSEDSGQEENDWKRKEGENSKHHDAYAGDADDGDGKRQDNEQGQKSEYQKLLKRYSPQEIALLRALKHEKEYRSTLRQNDGKRKSPQTHNRTTIAIDEQDQFSPDNWLPRSENLIRLTGKHPVSRKCTLLTTFGFLHAGRAEAEYCPDERRGRIDYSVRRRPDHSKRAPLHSQPRLSSPHSVGIS